MNKNDQSHTTSNLKDILSFQLGENASRVCYISHVATQMKAAIWDYSNAVRQHFRSCNEMISTTEKEILETEESEKLKLVR